MRKLIIGIIICVITFGIIILNINSKENKKENENNKNISIILETEEGNIESNTFPNKDDYEYSNVICENINDEVIPTFNTEEWKLNLSVEKERIDGNFNCTIHFKENTPPNPPVLDGDMVPVYYDEVNSVWRKADETNVSSEHKWYDYNNKMWANSITYDHTKILDLSSKNNDVSPTGAKYTSEGMYFDGTDDYINAGYENYDFESSITLIIRFKLNEFTASDVILGNPEAAGTFLAIQSSGNLMQFAIYGENNNNNDYYRLRSNNALELNKWYTAVGAYDGNTMKLYINGKLENTLTVSDSIKPIDLPFFIGANPQRGDSHLEYFNGTISDAIVINDVLSESEIKENYSDEVNHKENENTLFAYNLQGYEGRSNGEVIPMEAISTMQVWIPRYKYKVWNYNSDGTSTSEPQQIDIKFERGSESTGEITCTDNIQGEDGDGTSEVCKLGNELCTDNLCNGSYYTHPAFTFGNEELTGFWVGKFEVNGTIDNITTKPNLSSIRNQRIGDFLTNIMSMNDSGNIYGFITNVDTHMIKNSEWGSIAYLSNSKYGICENGNCTGFGINNNSNFITGCGAEVGSGESTTCNAYNTTLGQLASTTGNIYGVYDMSGGAWEYTMANSVSIDGKEMLTGFNISNNSGFTGMLYNNGNYILYDGDYPYPESKYYDKYSLNDDSHVKSNSKLGDAIKEMHSNTDAWGYGFSLLTSKTTPWIHRGGSLQNNLFTSNSGIGFARTDSTSRIIISLF